MDLCRAARTFKRNGNMVDLEMSGDIVEVSQLITRTGAQVTGELGLGKGRDEFSLLRFLAAMVSSRA